MQHMKVCILGGTGFVGRHLAAKLNDAGHQVKVISRRPHRHRELLVIPGVTVVNGSPADDDDLRREFTGMDAVINLIGILNESGHDGRGFEAVHADLPARVAAICEQVGVRRLLHMSALNAGVRSSGSHYLRTKGEGERRVLAASGDRLAVTVFRPSLIFGRGDGIFGRFAGLIEMSPILPLACPNSRFAPVFVGDVSEAFLRAMDDPDSFGKGFDLCGPRQYSLRQLVEYTACLMGKKPVIWSLGDTLSRWQANLFEYLPGKLFSRDNYRTLQTDSVPTSHYQFPFGIDPSSVESIVPTFFGQHNARSRFTAFRSRAGR